MNYISNKKAISLIVLVITIVVMTILASTVIVSLTDVSIIGQANNSVEATEIAQEKEAINVSVAQAMLQNKKRELTKNELESILKEKFNEDNALYEVDGKLYIYIEQSKRTYSVDIDTYEVQSEAYEEYEIAKYIEEIKKAYNEAKKDSTTNAQLFEKVRQKLNYSDTTYKENSVAMVISTKYDFTLIEDGDVKKGKYAYLSIADGSIEIYSDGYTQNGGTKEAYVGKYTITGKTDANVVKVHNKATYDITIKDLSINLSSGSNLSAFNANKDGVAEDLFVNISLEGSNYLKGSDGPGLGFAKGTPNVNGVTNGSTLTIQGDGELLVEGCWANAAIGSGYTGYDSCAGDANNIIINSGTITAKGGQVAGTIGGGLRRNANNIVINGGTVNAIQTSNGCGIGSYSGTTKNVVINGGVVTAKGGDYGCGIHADDITINGGIVKAYSNLTFAALGVSKHYALTSNITINGGTVITNAPRSTSIHVGLGELVINGGSLLATSFSAIETSEAEDGSVTITQTTTNPTNGTNTLYATPVKLQNAGEQIKVESITFSDNIEYNVNDIYTSKVDTDMSVTEAGVIYLYLPEGTRTISVKAAGKTYTGTVTTTTTNSVVTLSEN